MSQTSRTKRPRTIAKIIASKSAKSKTIEKLTEDIELSESRFKAFENAMVLKQQEQADAFQKQIDQMVEEACNMRAKFEKAVVSSKYQAN